MRRHLVETSRGAIHLRTHGGGDRTPLVLLHMSPQSSDQHALIAPLLGSDRLVVMPDRLGFGDSDPLPKAPFTLAEIARVTLEAVTALGVGRFDVFGIHTGSSEAVELAAVTAPERVRRVAVVAVPAFSADELAQFRDLFKPPPPPADDGRLLRWLWRFATGQFQPALDRPGWGVEHAHAIQPVHHTLVARREQGGIARDQDGGEKLGDFFVDDGIAADRVDRGEQKAHGRLFDFRPQQPGGVDERHMIVQGMPLL